jgi:hypothetical protein
VATFIFRLSDEHVGYHGPDMSASDGEQTVDRWPIAA